jgi:hypothetical protein
VSMSTAGRSNFSSRPRKQPFIEGTSSAIQKTQAKQVLSPVTELNAIRRSVS